MGYKILQGDCLSVLPTLEAQSAQCIVTSPPYYGLRDYKVDGQIGLEQTPNEYIDKLVAVFHECWRVLRDDGTLFLNLGDSYASSTKGSGGGLAKDPKNYTSKSAAYGARRFTHDVKPKDLLGIPWRVALALQSEGWYLRSDIIWHKPNPMPESVTDRPTKSHEYIFLLAKRERYYYDAEAVKEQSKYYGIDKRSGIGNIRYSDKKRNGEDGQGQESFVTINETRNLRDVWTVATHPYSEAHFATFPPKLIEPCILAGSRPGDTVLDPFNGAGTTGLVSLSHNRNYVGIELNHEYIELTHKRLAEVQPNML
jgi:DNA modification methylase